MILCQQDSKKIIGWVTSAQTENELHVTIH